MNPYFKPSRYKKHVNEQQEHTQHTKNNVHTHELHSTQPSSQLDVSTLPQHAQPIIVPISTTPVQPATHRPHRTQRAQNTEPSQTKENGTTSTDTNNQQKKMSCSAQKLQPHSMSPTARSKTTRHSSTDNEHYISSPVFQPGLKNR